MNQKRVFVVEDNEDIRDIISCILESTFYAVQLFGTTGEFNETLKQNLPDLVVLDIMLPDGNGIELCKKIKTNPGTRHIPVLLMSANRYEKKEEAFADGFISKPFNIDAFKHKVESFL